MIVYPDETLLATDLVRLSLLRFIALNRMKDDILTSLDRAIFDSWFADQLQADVNGYSENFGWITPPASARSAASR